LRGSEATLDALASGADDFVAKPAWPGGASSPEDAIGRELLPKIRQFFREDSLASAPAVERMVPAPAARSKLLGKDLETFRPAALVIASSTGGPAAHDTIFRGMSGKLGRPIFIAQHMPPVFTTSFAKRIADISGLPCKEAVSGETVQNEIYVAPGDYHLTLAREGDRVVTRLDKESPRNSVRPAADSLFESASAIYGSRCMGFVLTGMGEDGLAGARQIKANGGGIMIQSEQSCVVFGMPGAVCAAGLYDAVGSLERVRTLIARMVLQ
jgi:two-component system chemotaxis response regulator CheB